MKITANRRDDIIKQRDQYEADYQAKQEKYDQESDKLRRAEYEVMHGVEEKVKAALADVSQGAKLDIRARKEWLTRSDDITVSIYVMCNENEKFDDTTALAWNWSVKLDDDGNVIKDSGSWSGLKACTAAQLEDLQRSLEIMKRLNDMDWGDLLSAEMPRYRDYVTEGQPYRGNRPNFEQMLFDIDIEEAIGKPVLIKGADDYSRMWFSILKQSDKQYTVVRIPEYALKDEGARNGKTIQEYVEMMSAYPMRVMKTKFATMVEKPIKYWEE